MEVLCYEDLIFGVDVLSLMQVAGDFLVLMFSLCCWLLYSLLIGSLDLLDQYT